MTVVAIHQPEYLPCLTLLGKISQADVLVLLDDVQFKRDSLQQRAWIADENGKERWLTIPYVHKHPQLISDVQLADPEWGLKHEQIVRQLYHEAPYLSRLDGLLSFIWKVGDMRLRRAATETADVLLRAFDAVPRRVYLSSEFRIGTTDKSERIAEICRQVGGKTYLCGKSGAEYLDHAAFEKIGVEVVVNQNTLPEPYRRGCPEKIFRVSGLDAMLWCRDPSALVPHTLVKS